MHKQITKGEINCIRRYRNLCKIKPYCKNLFHPCSKFCTKLEKSVLEIKQVQKIILNLDRYTFHTDAI